MKQDLYLNAADHMPNDGSREVSDDIQRLIDENPNRVIFFPDGLYHIAKPVLTPADPAFSVSLKLSDFAVIQADPSWDSDEAMIRLGGSHPFNTIYVNGSNYSLEGGIIDGSGVAKAVSVDSGRETAVRDLSIKHAKVGIHIKHGANSGSSDADISCVNITGSGTHDSVGVLLEGYDNTLTNMRIANVFTGVKLCSAGNSLRNIHPLFTVSYDDYENSCGFLDMKGNNWYSFGYSDQFANGFRFGPDARGSVLDSCMCYWYSANGGHQVFIRCDGRFRSAVNNPKVGFRSGVETRAVLKVAEAGGDGFINNVCLNHGTEADLGDGTFRDYLRGNVI